jgi:hypothetical protein
LYIPTHEYIVCGDINIDYLINSDRKSRLNALLKTYNLQSVINFPTRIQNHSITAIDNIFIDASKMGNYSVTPIINGLSDHDAQLIILLSYILRPLSKKYISTRNIIMFNFFLDTYLKIFYSSFPLKRVMFKECKLQ